MTLRIAQSLLILLAVPAFVACRSTPPPASKTPANGGAPARPGEYLIRFQQIPDQLTLDAALDEVSAELIRSYELLPGLYHVKSPLDLAQVKNILDTNVDSVRANRLLFGSSIEPSASARQPEVLPYDEKFSSQWGLRNVGQTFAGGIGMGGADIRAAQGWSVATGTTAVIAVLDTGINLTHEDLEPNLWVNRAEENGVPNVDDDSNGYVDDVHGWNFVPSADSSPQGSPNVADYFGHGTEVASIIGAAGDNQKGITGVAWKCRIMPLRIFTMGKKGLTTDVATAIAALEYAVKNQAKVSCNSWGAYRCGDPDDFAELSEAIEVAGRCGHLFVTSAGNRKNQGTDNDASPFVPGSFPLDNIVAVTSIGYLDELPQNANYGPASVDLAAPGIQILTADQSTRDGYRFVSGGTSYATPHVAAAAALLWGLSDWSAPGAKTPQEVREHLIVTARPVASMAGKTISGGVLDLGALLGSPGPSGVVPVEASQPR